MKQRIFIVMIAAACFLFLLPAFYAAGAKPKNQVNLPTGLETLATPAQAVPPETPADQLNFSAYLPMVEADELPTVPPTPIPTQPSTWYAIGVYDDTHPGITYIGNWYDEDQAYAFQSTLRVSGRPGSRAVFHFEGRQISIFYSTFSNHGNFEVWIDGVSLGMLNQNSTNWYTQVQWNSPRLAAGRHTLMLNHVLGTINDLDALVVSDYAYPPGPGVPPPYSTSYYMKTVNTTTMYELGCGLGIDDTEQPGWQDQLVILDFGMPRTISSGVYGASLFGFGPASTTQIAEAIKAVGYGYVMCSLDEAYSRLKIGIGTSNYGSQVTYEHGRAWAQMVNQVNSQYKSWGFSQRVAAAGANEMELDWNTAAVTRTWVNGYDSANEAELYNFGDAAGCPSVNYPGWQCNNSWTLDDIWYISFGAPPSYPLPLIYANGGINAAQWHWIALYAYNNKGRSMDFQGEMTQWQTCITTGCESALDNSPAEGWTYLWTHLNSNPRTAQNLRYSTDIMYHR